MAFPARPHADFPRFYISQLDFFKLIKGHEYVLRVRLYYRNRSGETAVVMW